MESLTTFDIDLKNLKDEVTEFHFKFDDDFFKEIQGTEVEGGDLSGMLRITKASTVFALDFQAEGNVTVTCDRCLDPMQQPISAVGRLSARFGTEYSEEDDVIVVPLETGILNVAWHFYEFIALAVPVRHVHADGECNAEMIDSLKKWTMEEGQSPAQNDPRWKDLEKLKTIIKD